jgi:hypothetical protein
MSAIPDHLITLLGLPTEVLRRGIRAPGRTAWDRCRRRGGPASGADQRIAPGLVVQVAQPRLAQGLNGGWV